MRQRHNTSFVTLPIVALAAAALGVVIASLAIGAREVDGIALDRQRATIEQAIDQHGLALARELRVQSVWNEGYLNARADNVGWLHRYYGTYLNQLLGYDRVYVVSDKDEPIYGYVAADPKAKHSFDEISPAVMDLVAAVRDPKSNLPDSNVLKTQISLSPGHDIQHRAAADVRSIDGRPATVVVSTIVPDHAAPGEVDKEPYLLVTVEDLDKQFTSRIGNSFGFRELQWISGDVPKGYDTELVKSIDDKVVGTLAWKRDRPGMEFMQRAAPGLILALIPIAALTFLLIRWGHRQLNRIMQSEQHATHAARTDPLTDLPNRVALREVFTRLLSECRSARTPLAVLCIDFDHFKGINDAFGHAVGDAVLKASAGRLRRLAVEQGVVARPDGDSFVMLMPGQGEANAAELADDVIATLTEPFDLDRGTRVFLTASVGYAIGPRDGDTGEELMRRAELAVDKAKQNADEGAVAFAPDMDAEVTYRLMLEAALRGAVAEGAIGVVYQPLMDPSGRCVLGLEALARWTDAELGVISPDIFIPLAEETGLIQNIGEHVLRQAVADSKAWPGVTVAVNVSASQIHHGDVVEVVREAIRDAQFPAERLEIEITESVLLADEKRANEQMRGLQALGVRVALDDFGTGYSSLQYLRRFGFDKLKIDRSFIDGAGDPMGSSVVLASIIRLGQDLDLTITAEGVETEEQRHWLQAAGCHQLQGFLFSRPLKAEQVAAFISLHLAPAAVAS
ncbi:MAG: bifunctional diguanylate cyclase/phosphodiesterase [Hyphomicrobium sp.]